MQPAWAILWDVDGTLVDTAELHFRAWVQLAAELGKPFTREDFAATFGWRNPEIIPKLFGPHYSDAEIESLGVRKEESYRQEARKGLSLLPGVQRLLREVRDAGGRQAIGSSAPRGNLELLLEITHLREYFAAVIAMEDTTRGKPDPQVFLRAAERLEVPPARCVVIEDAPVGIQAARAAGMRAVGVTFVGMHASEHLAHAGADLVVPSLEQVSVSTLRGLAR